MITYRPGGRSDTGAGGLQSVSADTLDTWLTLSWVPWWPRLVRTGLEPALKYEVEDQNEMDHSLSKQCDNLSLMPQLANTILESRSSQPFPKLSVPRLVCSGTLL